jgi:holin-like protein
MRNAVRLTTSARRDLVNFWGPHQSWYARYWLEDHQWPGLAFCIARAIRRWTPLVISAMHAVCLRRVIVHGSGPALGFEKSRQTVYHPWPEINSYLEYWFERPHWPDLAFCVGRSLRTLLLIVTPALQRCWLQVKGGQPYWVLVRDLAGFGLIVLSLIAGSLASSWSGFPISGSVLGMVILLCLLRLFTGAAKIVRRSAAVLLYLLPALFVPLYVVPFSDATFWLRYGPTLLPVVATGVAIMMTLTRFLTIRMMRNDHDLDPSA